MNQPNPRLQFPIMLFSVFFCYLAMVMPLSSLSILVTRDWGMSNFMGGITAGAAFFITMLLRKNAGDMVDRRGGRNCFLRGCLWYAAGSAFCFGAALDTIPVPGRFCVLLLGRLIIGFGESMTNIGMASWAVDVVGVSRGGRIFANIGMAMYGAAAVGGQTGFYLFEKTGFSGLIAASTLCPLIGLAFASQTCPMPPPQSYTTASGRISKKPGFFEVISTIWRDGVPACCHAAGFAVLGAFLSKTFMERGWEYAGMGLTCYGIGFVTMRMFIGHLPDKIGGLPVAAGSAIVEMGGLYLLWLAPNPHFALASAFITGIGCSMIFPSLGLNILQSVSQRMRGACLSCYNIFIDLSYALAGPVAGLFADRYGENVAYLFAAFASTAGLGFILNQMRRKSA